MSIIADHPTSQVAVARKLCLIDRGPWSAMMYPYDGHWTVSVVPYERYPSMAPYSIGTYIVYVLLSQIWEEVRTEIHPWSIASIDLGVAECRPNFPSGVCVSPAACSSLRNGWQLLFESLVASLSSLSLHYCDPPTSVNSTMTRLPLVGDAFHLE